MSQHPFYTEADAARRGSLPYPGANHEVPENSPFATAGSTHPEQVSSPITTFSHQQQQSFQDPYHNAPPSALSVADSRNWPLQRNPTQSTVSPFDSASNWGGDDDLSHKGRFTQSQHLGQYGQSNYLQQDPYGRASQASLAPHTNAGPNPYEEHDEYDHHHDSSRLPLVENAAYADTSRGGAGGYAQPYDTSEQQYPPTSVIEKNRANRESHASGSEGQNILGELEKARAQRPPIWQRLLRDTTPLEDRVYYKQQGIGVQSRPWLCWVLSGGMIIAMIVVLARQWKLTDSPIATKPQFNPMIGPVGLRSLRSPSAALLTVLTTVLRGAHTRGCSLRSMYEARSRAH